MTAWSLLVSAPWQEPGTRRAFVLALLLHGVWACTLGLSPDEAHYALYGTHLAWSYFDHPPLVGWLQALVLPWSQSEWALRLWPLATWWMTGSLLLSLNQLWFPQVAQTQWLGVRIDAWLWLTSLLPHLMGLAWVPDALLMPMTLGLMALTWRLGQPHANWRHWLGLGVLLGLAGLSKYTAVLLGVSVGLGLQAQLGWSLWRQRGWWLALVIALVLVAPVVLWNAQNDWISFRYQIAHAQGGAEWHAHIALRYGVVVLLGLGLIWPAVAWARTRDPKASGGHAWRWPTARDPVTLVGLFALPMLVVLLKASGRGSALPHWATPLGVALLPWVCACMAQGVGALRAWVKLGLVLQASVVLGFAGVMVWGGLPAESATSVARSAGDRNGFAGMNPVADLHGWEEAAERAKALAQAQGLSGLAVTNWTLGSRLAWYARPLSVRIVDDHGDQFNLWFDRFRSGDAVLWVDWSQMTFAPPVGPERFARCERLGGHVVTRAGRTLSHFHFYRCDDWQGKHG